MNLFHPWEWDYVSDCLEGSGKNCIMIQFEPSLQHSWDYLLKGDMVWTSVGSKSYGLINFRQSSNGYSEYRRC